MNPNEQSDTAPKRARSIWKLWLGIAIAVACVVWAQIERHSPEAERRRQQGANNVVSTVRNEAYVDCSATKPEAECRQQAQDAADFGRKKVAPLVEE